MPRRFTTIAGLAALCAAAGLVAGFNLNQPEAQPGDMMVDPAMMQPEQIKAMLQEMGKPGEAHEQIKRMAGEWTYEFKMVMMPGMPEVVSRGTATQEMVLGGRCLSMNSQMDFNMGGGVSLPMKGMGWIGYNQHTGEYQMTWMDTIDPYIMVQSGPMNEDGEMVLEGNQYADGSAVGMKTVIRFTDDDHYVMEFWAANPMDPNETYRTVVIEHTRAE